MDHLHHETISQVVSPVDVHRSFSSKDLETASKEEDATADQQLNQTFHWKPCEHENKNTHGS